MTSFRGESLARDPKAFTYGIEVNPNIACSVKTIPLSRRDKSQPVSRSARSESLVEVGNVMDKLVGALGLRQLSTNGFRQKGQGKRPFRAEKTSVRHTRPHML